MGTGLFEYERLLMVLLPAFPCSIFRNEFGKDAFEIFPLYSHEAIRVGVPHCSTLFIVENESILVGPSGGCQCKYLSIYLAAVHSR